MPRNKVANAGDEEKRIRARRDRKCAKCVGRKMVNFNRRGKKRRRENTKRKTRSWVSVKARSARMLFHGKYNSTSTREISKTEKRNKKKLIFIF